MTDTAAPVPPAAEPPAPAAIAPPRGHPRARKRLLSVLGVLVLLALITWAAFHFLLAVPEEGTDDAYVAGDVFAVTARDPGTVLAIHADNTQIVKAGQPLIDLDPDTAEVNLSAAEAELARAVRATRATFSRLGETGAEVAQARAQLERATNDYSRRRGAAAEGAISGEELSHAADAVNVARATLALAQSRQTQSRDAVAGTDVASNPAVLSAIANYRRAAISRGHMHVTAPIDGVVAQRTVQIGQQIAAGTPLLAVVPLDRVWVDANFRETQLRDLRIGQSAKITADTYGDDIVYHGRVIGVGAGSGSAFALLPPQNASGNWIKIVQRVPVRIELNREELRRNPLRIGLSVDATVDTAKVGGQRLGLPAASPASNRSGQSSATGSRDPQVEARIRQIIAANR